MVAAVIGIDVGTSSTKAIIFDLEGNEVSRASSHPYHNSLPEPGWVEQDPEEIWNALITTIHEAIINTPQSVEVQSIAMSVQSGSLIPADEFGRPTYQMITWLDGRSEGIVQEWKSEGVEKWVKQKSGWSLYPSLCLPTIAWIKRYNPLVGAKSKYFFSLNDFLVFRLTGKMITNPSNAGGMQLVNIHTSQWDRKLTSLAGIEPENLSTLMPSVAVIAPLLPEICLRTGLPNKVLLVNGGHDQGCTALGTGITEPGKWLLACGTAWVFTGVQNTSDMEHLPPELDLNFHVPSGRWTVSQSLGGLGASFEYWFNKTYLSTNASESREKMLLILNEEMLHTVTDPKLIFLPMTGGHADPATTRRGGFLGMQLSHTRADFARAIMESAAYELKWAIQPILQANYSIDQFWMVGGAAHSSIWSQILADTCEVPISLPDFDNWSALGAAIIAGLGIGAFSSLENAMEIFRKPEKIIYPQADRINVCQQSFREYQRLVELYQ